LEIALVDSSLLPEKEEESDYKVPEDTSAVGSDLEKVRRHWDDFVDACREYNRNIAAVLQQVSKLINVEDGTITLGFQVKNLKEKIEEHRQEIEEKAKEVFGTPYKIQCVLVEREGKPKKTPLSESKLVKTLEEKYGARRVG
jgi:predicted RNase H-like nuclease (RuvC/YqgF family)